MKRTKTSRQSGRFRVAAVAVPALAGLLVAAMPAEAAERQVFSYSVPTGAKAVWIDIESPDVTLENTDSETNLGSEWTTTPLRNTAFGVSAVIPVNGERVQLRVNSSSRSAADVSLSFTGSDDALIHVESQRIRLDGGTADPIPTPVPTATNGPGEGTEPSLPTPVPTATNGPDSASPAPEGEDGNSEPEETTAPSPMPSSTSSLTPAGSAGEDGPAQGSSEASNQSNLSSTGWSPTLLFGALGLLLAGTVAVLIARKNGAHA